MPRKNTMIISICGILTLLIMLAGASFAYFNIQTNADKETAAIKSNSAAPSGVVTFTTKTENLNFSIADAEMSTDKIGTKYYATNDITQNYATENDQHVFTLAEARVNGGNKSFKCYYDFTITLGNDNTMIPNNPGEVVLNFAGDSVITSSDKIDLTELLQKKSLKLSGYFYPLNPVRYEKDGRVIGIKIITMELYVKNINEEQGGTIANKQLSVHIEPTFISDTENMFKCDGIKH